MMVHANPISPGMADPGLARHGKRKAAAEMPEGNERLSKRLSLLNLDNPGAKAYLAVGPPSSTPAVGISAPAAAPTLPAVLEEPHSGTPAGSAIPAAPASAPVLPPLPLPLDQNLHGGMAALPGGGDDDDAMRMDDTKYKLYIHSIDDELADDDDDDEVEALQDGQATYEAAPTRDDSGKLVFLPAIDRHLRAAARDAVLGASSAQPHQKLAVPRPILPNKEGELAGMQVVLYRDPTSLSVAPENDSVRQAILDSRARFRERRREEDERESARLNRLNSLKGEAAVDIADVDDDISMTSTPVPGTPVPAAADPGNELDAMDLD